MTPPQLQGGLGKDTIKAVQSQDALSHLELLVLRELPLALCLLLGDELIPSLDTLHSGPQLLHLSVIKGLLLVM